jgi:hypothetical protein
MNQMAAMSYANEPPPQTNSTNHQSRNSPFQCSNLFPGPHQTVSTMKMEEMAKGGAADWDAVDVGVGIINAHCLQTLDAMKVVAMQAKAAVAVGFHRHQDQESFIHMC